MKFGNKRKTKPAETFLGALRVVADEDTIQQLRGNTVVSQYTRDGIRYTKFANGDIEIKSWNELIEDQVKVMREVNP